GLAARLGAEESQVPFLRPALESLQKHVDEASKAYSLQDPSACAAPLLAGRDETEKLVHQLEGSQLPAAAKDELLTILRTKLEQFQQAANESLGIYFEVTVDPPGPPPGPSYFPRMEQTISMAVPGQTFTVTARLYNRGKTPLTTEESKHVATRGWTVTPIAPEKEAQHTLAAGDVWTTRFKVSVPEDANYTRPYFTRQNAET